MKIFSSRRSALFLAFVAFTPMTQAQDLIFNNHGSEASLVELYSSEGCSSCPPAEAWLNRLKTAPGLWRGIFPVAFHVDYWDNLGWPDKFASADYTQRQRDYATRLNQDSVYTPEFVVNGLEWKRGWLSDRLPNQATMKAGDLTLTVQAADKKLSARYVAPAAGGGDLTLNVALLGFNIVSDVMSGENGGRKLEHDFVVLGFHSAPLVRADGGAFLQAPADAPSAISGETPGAIVAWVSDSGGKILQVTGGWLPKATPGKG